MAYAVIVDNVVWDKFAMISLAEDALYNQKLVMKEKVDQKKAELKSLKDTINKMEIKEIV
mgnify:FL=1|jgi:hypothetical protein